MAPPGVDRRQHPHGARPSSAPAPPTATSSGGSGRSSGSRWSGFMLRARARRAGRPARPLHRGALLHARDRLGHPGHQWRQPVRRYDRRPGPAIRQHHPGAGQSEDPVSGPAVDPPRHPGADSRLRNDPHQYRLQQRNPSLLVTVLDQDFGIQINHVAVFNFDTFEAVADAVGGVEQYFPTPAQDSFPTCNIPAAGCYNLSGAQALAFVRSREYQYYLNGQWQLSAVPRERLGPDPAPAGLRQGPGQESQAGGPDQSHRPQ